MPVPLTSDQDVYCYLKSELEPTYRVMAEPFSGYFAQWQFCYRVFDGDRLMEEFCGDFRSLPDGSLLRRARSLVERLAQPEDLAATQQSSSAGLPFASRLPPKRSETTWFSSGRAAFAWLVRDVVRPQRLFLPTFVCWSLVDVMLSKFPDIELSFYTVDRQLRCEFPSALDQTDALLFIHYFGHTGYRPPPDVPCTVLEDASHLLLSDAERLPTLDHEFRFGSLRKAYRVADGGFVSGEFSPHYQPSSSLDAWLRLRSSSWTDLREAENMTDRAWAMSDISSQSLAVVLTSDEQRAIDHRRANHDFLSDHLDAGTALLPFRASECPLLHFRTFDSQAERDSLRAFLAQRQLFTSIHWPTHPYLLQRRDQFDVDDALWLENHSLAIPVSDDFQLADMEYVCVAVDDWKRAGAAELVSRVAG